LNWLQESPVHEAFLLVDGLFLKGLLL